MQLTHTGFTWEIEYMKPYRFIDSHAHLAADYESSVLDRIAESDSLKQVWLLPIECYDRKFNFAGNKQVLEVAKRYPGFFIPFGFIDFGQGADQVDRFKEMGFTGLKAIRPPQAYDHPDYFPIYERTQALNMPILFHVGIISRKTREELTMPAATGPTQMRPSMLDSIAAAFPRLKMIQGHMGVPWCNELFESLWYYPNICASVSGLIDYKWLMENLDRRSEDETPFSRKMMFAVDGRYGHEDGFELIMDQANFFRQFFLNVGATYCWGGAVDDYMYNNAAKFMEELI